MKDNLYGAYNKIGNEFKSRDDIGVLSVFVESIGDGAVNKAMLTNSLIVNCDEVSAIRVGKGIKVYLSKGYLLSEVADMSGKVGSSLYRIDKRMLFNNIHVTKVDLSRLKPRKFYGKEAFRDSHIEESIIMPDFSECNS